MTIRKIDLESYTRQAKAAGLPQDQIDLFVNEGYAAITSMLPFHAAARLADKSDGPDELALGGTRYAAKSHAAMAQAGLDDLQRFPGLKYLYLRKVQRSASEAFEDLVSKVFRYVEHGYAEGIVRFPNGSRMLIGGYNDENQIDKYLGIEYDGAVIEEATQLSENKIQKIYGSIRTTYPGYRSRKYLTTNPDGIGIAWFKQRFIIPWRTHTQKWTWFQHCSYKDNPFATREYTHYLETLTGALAKAWRDGDWDAFEGMALPNWNQELHVREPFEIPDHWPLWRAIDWGYAAPWVCGWFAKDPDIGRIYMIREAVGTQLTEYQQADRIKDMTLPAEIARIQFTFADPAMWAKKTYENKVTSSYDLYKDRGVILTKADNDRINGKRKVSNVLGILPDGLPGIQFFENCPYLIYTLPLLPSDPNRPEDVDTNAEDHGYDMLKYGLTNYRLPPEPSRARQNASRSSPLTYTGVL